MTNEYLTPEQLRALIKESVREAVDEALLKAGMDMSEPISLQKDLAFIRSARIAREKMTTKVFLTITSVLVTSALGFMVAGALGWIKTGGH